MKAKEVYFKYFKNSEIPVERIFYTTKNENVINVWANICVDFNVDEKKEILRMKNIERMEGFLFWNISPEAYKFFDKHKDLILKSLYAGI